VSILRLLLVGGGADGENAETIASDVRFAMLAIAFAFSVDSDPRKIAPGNAASSSPLLLLLLLLSA